MPIEAHSKELHATALADYMPDGPLFEAKNISDSNFRKLLLGFSGELFTAEGYLKTFEQEYNPLNTVLFIEEWERAVGIPDDCFIVASTIDERRQNILTKLAALGIQTEQDFIDLAALLGITVTISQPSEGDLLPPYDIPYTLASFPGARFVIVVTGVDLVSGFPPYSIPLDLESGETILECLFNKVRPDNCSVIFKNS